MANLLLLLPNYYLLTSIFLLLNSIIDNSNGLKLELIHPSSQKSYFSQTNEEKIQKLLPQSVRRTNYLINTTSKAASNNTTLKQGLHHIARPLVDTQWHNYIVKIGIGTFKSVPPFKEYYLDMDTGSSLTWMQCEGCRQCFEQTPNPFPWKESTSLHLFLDEHNKPSSYNSRYDDGTYSSGILARETIHLNSNNNSMVSVQNFAFGCGLRNFLTHGEYENNRIAGILGLAWGTYSFVNQIRESNGRFSYCLPFANSSTTSRPKTYLRFGDDILLRDNASSTKMKKAEGSDSYYVRLEGISINKNRLNISSSVFHRPNGDEHGCRVDSGAMLSRIIEPAYHKLHEGIEYYFFRSTNIRRVFVNDIGLDCFERQKPEGYENLPDITFHFQNADFVVRPEAGFEVSMASNRREHVCLAMISSKDISIIGSYQQTNQRIVYDTWREKLMFHPEDCSENP